MRKTLLVVALLITVTFLVACHSEQRPPIPTENDGDQVEEMDTADPDEAASEADLESEQETEHEAELLDGDAETEAEPESERETEIEPEGYVAPETDVDLDEIPRAERLPFSGTLVFPCADEQAPISTNAIWGDGAGSVYIGGNEELNYPEYSFKHLWRYDETTNILSCDPETFGPVLALDGRRVAGQTQIWVLAGNRVARHYDGKWSSFPLPNDSGLITSCLYVDSIDTTYKWFCGWSSLKVNKEQVIVTVTTAKTEGACYDASYMHAHYPGPCMGGSAIFRLQPSDGTWIRSSACPNLLPGEETQGYWLNDTYYVLGGSTLYALTNDASFACQNITTFTPETAGNRLRLYGADESGLWIGEYKPGGLGSDFFRQLSRVFVYDPSHTMTTSLALPEAADESFVSSNGLAGVPTLFRSYKLTDITPSGTHGIKCEETFSFHHPAHTAIPIFADVLWTIFGESCAKPDFVYEEWSLRPPMQAQHWRDDKTAWLPDLMMRITYTR